MLDSITISTINNRLKGYIQSPRQKILLIKAGLSEREYVLLDFIETILINWDERKVTYGTFIYLPEYITNYLGWSTSKVYDVFSSLQKRKLISVVNKKGNLFKLNYYNNRKMIIGSKDERDKDPFAYIQSITANTSLENKNLNELLNLENNQVRNRKIISKSDKITPNIKSKIYDSGKEGDINTDTNEPPLSKYSSNISSFKGVYNSISNDTEYRSEEEYIKTKKELNIDKELYKFFDNCVVAEKGVEGLAL